MLEQSEMDKVVLEAKKSLSDNQIKDALRKCSYGGSPVNMVMTTRVASPLDCQGIIMKGGDVINGKTNA